MNKEEILNKIIKFEEIFGESFNDRFSHDNISFQSWSFYLLGKGFVEHANTIIECIVNSRDVEQDILFDIKSLEWSEDSNNDKISKNWDFNMTILAEFISLTPTYLERFKAFLNESEI